MEKTNKKRNPIAALLVAIGIISLLIAGGWYLHNLLEDIAAEHASREIVEVLSDVIEERQEGEDGKKGSETSETTADTDTAETKDYIDDYVDPVTDPSMIEMDTEVVEEVPYIGIIEIPSAGLKLPVSYNWDYGLLSVSPCRYKGSYLTDDMVICAHDYGSHFRAIRSLGIGESVFFTAMTGERIKYIVSNIETVQPTDIDKMIVNTSEGSESHLWDLTLFTCNIGGQTRCAVRLERAK